MAATTPERAGTRSKQAGPALAIQEALRAYGVTPDAAPPEGHHAPVLPMPSAPEQALMSGEDLADVGRIEAELAAAYNQNDAVVQDYAASLGLDIPTVRSMLTQNEDLVAGLLRFQVENGLVTGEDLIHGVTSAKGERSYASDNDDALVDYGSLPNNLLSRTPNAATATAMMRRVMQETPSKKMFAPLWPPVAEDGFQDPPRLVNKTDIIRRIRDPLRPWSTMPRAPLRPAPAVRCPLCTAKVYNAKEMQIHSTVRHKDAIEGVRREREVAAIESQAEDRAYDRKLREQELEVQREQLALLRSQVELGLNRLGLATPEQARAEQAEVAAPGHEATTLAEIKTKGRGPSKPALVPVLDDDDDEEELE